MGTGSLEAVLQQKIQELELQSTVEIVGPRPQNDVFQLVQQAAVFAAPYIIGQDGNLRYFWPYIQKQYGLLLISAIALVADVGLRVLEPWPLKFVFDYVLIPGDRPTNILLIDRLEPVTLLTLSAVTVLVITGLRALAAYWSTVGLATVGSRVMTQVRNHLYCHLQDLSLAYHTKTRSDDLIIRVSSDANRLQEIIITAALPLVVSILILFGMIGVMLWVNRDLTLLALLTLPLFASVTNRLNQRIRESSLKQRKQEGSVAATAAESIAAIKLVKGLLQVVGDNFV